MGFLQTGSWVLGQLLLKTAITANSNIFKLFCSNILLSSVRRGIFSQSGHFLLHCNSALISGLSYLAGKASLAGSLSPEYEKYIFAFSSDSVLVPSSYIYFLFKWPVEMVRPGSVSSEYEKYVCRKIFGKV